MDFFEERYSPQNDYYDENDEKERQRLLASMLAAAAADLPTGGLRNVPEVHAGFGHDPTNQSINRKVDELGYFKPLPDDQEGHPIRIQSILDFLLKPEDSLDDLDFFDRNVPPNLFRNIAGSIGPDEDS